MWVWHNKLNHVKSWIQVMNIHFGKVYVGSEKRPKLPLKVKKLVGDTYLLNTTLSWVHLSFCFTSVTRLYIGVRQSQRIPRTQYGTPSPSMFSNFVMEISKGFIRFNHTLNTNTTVLSNWCFIIMLTMSFLHYINE